MIRWIKQAMPGLLLVWASVAIGQSAKTRTPEEIARSVVERVQRETSFELRDVVQKPVLCIQVVEFGRESGYAGSLVTVAHDTILAFGLSRHFPLKITVNGDTVYEARNPVPFVFKEIGYGVFRFGDTVRLPLKRGKNSVGIRSDVSGDRNIVYLKELGERGARGFAQFGPGDTEGREGLSPWVCTFQHSPGYIVELAIKPDAVYRKESYAEWGYPNGAMMLALLRLSSWTNDTSVFNFVKQYCNFTLEHDALFRAQYERRHAFRGTNHKLYRASMLDDTGAPALPFIEMLLRTHDARLESIVANSARCIEEEQLRLGDRTFCRYEPTPGTVWADDLFMSVPFLVRMTRLTGDASYLDDAVRQALNFRKYLVDGRSGLYRHGWFDAEGRQSRIPWGRANGWVVWATSELLESLPGSHPMRGEIEDNFRQHMRALVSCQSPSGLWHQVLDRPDSFEETSCSAMFIIGIARGLRWGILDSTFSGPLTRAWGALQRRVSEDGIVKGICRGTELSEDPNYYFARECFDNDPRGLGAVITACVEMSKGTVRINTKGN